MSRHLLRVSQKARAFLSIPKQIEHSFTVQKRNQSTDAYVPPSKEVNPAYDAALEYLEQYSQARLDKVKDLEKILSSSGLNENERVEYENNRHNLLVESKIHMPSTEWKFKNNKYDPEEPVFHYLLSKQWVEENRPVLEQRLDQMFVIPDVIPPGSNLDAQIKVTYTSTSDAHEVNPGIKILSEETQKCPKIHINAFHKESRLYTLVFVDPDSPAPEIQNYSEKAHWAACNIPISFSSGEVDLTKAGDLVIPYLPPHPQQGTDTHRYTFILLEQPESGLKKLDPNSLKAALSESSSNVRSLITSLNLTVRGAHFFRSNWSTYVSSYYKDVLNIPEPIFGPKPFVNPRVGPDGRIRNRYLNA